MEFDPDEYQKFKYHCYVQRSCVPAPPRAPITILEQFQTFLKIEKSNLIFRKIEKSFTQSVVTNVVMQANQLGKITNNVKNY